MRYAAPLLIASLATPGLAQTPVPHARSDLAFVKAGGTNTSNRAALPRPNAGPAPFSGVAEDEAAKAALPYALVDTVMKIESDYDPNVVGGVGEIGLMQVRPQTAAMLGFKGLPGQLADPATNIHYGTIYLGQAWHLTRGDVCRTLMKYRAGTGEEMMSALSLSYCARARAHLVAIGSPLAALIMPNELVAEKPAVAAGGKSTAGHGRGRARSGKAFWLAFEAKIKLINARLEAHWKKVATR